MSTVQLRASTRPFGVAELSTDDGLVMLQIGPESARMGFSVELSPACARELAAALLAQAEAIKPTAPPPSRPAEPVQEATQPQVLPATGFVRQSELIPHIVPFASTTLWRKVKSGEFPAPVKLSERVTAWRVEDVRGWMSARA